MDAVMTVPPPTSIRTWAVVVPRVTSTTRPLIMLRALSFIANLPWLPGWPPRVAGHRVGTADGTGGWNPRRCSTPRASRLSNASTTKAWATAEYFDALTTAAG